MNHMQPQRLSAPAPSRILRPGIRQLPQGVQRHVVRGGGSLVVEVFAGDKLQLTDMEGGQVCEVLFFDAGMRFLPLEDMVFGKC